MLIDLKILKICLKRYVRFITVEKGLSKNSVEAQKNDLRILYVFIKNEQGSVFDFQKVSVIIDLIAFEKAKGKTASSLNRLLSTIKSFTNFCLEEFKMTSSPILKIESLKSKKHPPSYIKEGDMEKLLSPHSEKKEEPAHRLMLEILYALGLRVSELCGLKKSDIDEGSHLVKINGKGGKQRHVPIYDELIEKINAYVNENHIGQTDLLFSLSRQKVWSIVKQRGLDVGLEIKLHPHLFRHSFASHMIQRGAKIREIQELLGHSDIQTTEIYTHLDKSYLKNILNEKHKL